MTARCVVALGRGLDGALAAAMMRDQNIDVLAFHMTTPFSRGEEGARRWAESLDVPLEIVPAGDDYATVVRHPRFRRGRKAAPCLDCRIRLFDVAREVMDRTGRDFVVSGEVLGQRRVGQRRIDLESIARHSGLDDRLLRPLSALALEDTAPERLGLVDRGSLLAIVGADRAPQRRLAEARGWTDLPDPAECCSLTNPAVAARVFDLLALPPRDDAWQLETLAFGRHYRLSTESKLVLGRDAMENARMERLFRAPADLPRRLLRPVDFEGPTALIIGAWDAVEVAAALVVRHSRQCSGTVEATNEQGEVALVRPTSQSLEIAAQMVAIGVDHRP